MGRGLRWLRWIVGGTLMVLGLFDVPDQIEKVQRFLGLLADELSRSGFDQNGWRWAFVIIGVLIATAPELTQRIPWLRESTVARVETAGPALPRPRTFVGEGVTPRYLLDLYRAGQTTLQKEAAVAPYKGKWMRVEGTIKDVASDHLELAEFQSKIVNELDLRFGPMWKQRLELLAPGPRVVVVGEIADVNAIWLTLRNCELADT